MSTMVLVIVSTVHVLRFHIRSTEVNLLTKPFPRNTHFFRENYNL
jgi:hypothetical protein